MLVDGNKIEVQPEFEPLTEHWTPEVTKLLEDSKTLEELITKIRELVPYTMAYKNEKRRPNFKKELQDEWAKLEQIVIVAMLYHSNSIDEAKRFLNKPSSTNDQIEEMFKLIGS